MRLFTGLLALALIIYSGVMIWAVWGFPKRGPRYKIAEPVLTLELARNGDELSNLFEVSGYDAHSKLLCDTHLDNFYIPTYVSFLVATILLIRQRTAGRIRALGTVAVLFAVLAGLFDAMENYNIFIALRAPQMNDALAAAIRHPSEVKWFFLFTTYMLIGLLLLRRAELLFGRATNFILAMMLATSGIIGYIGLLFCRSAIPVSSLLFAALPILCLKFLRKQKESWSPANPSA